MRLLVIAGLLFVHPLLADKIHVIDSPIAGNYNVVIHHNRLASGVNSAGKTWVSILATLQQNGSAFLPVGNGTAEITNAENNNLIGGLLHEIKAKLKGCPVPPNNACINELADTVITTEDTKFRARFVAFGMLVN